MLSFQLLTILLFLCLFERYAPYTFNGFEIRDLEYTGSDFIAETNSWTASGLMYGVKYTTCGTYLLGGPSVLATICGIHTGYYGSCSQWGSYFTKTFDNLPAHTYVFFSVTYWAFRSWDLAWDYFELDFDGLSIDGWKMSAGNFATTTCGVTTEPNMKVYGRFPHAASSIKVTFYSRMDEATDNESWGVRDFNMLFVKNPSVTGTSYCAAPWTIPNLPTSWRCPFSAAGYYGTTSSTACNAACASCYGTGSNQCYECNAGYFWNGNNCVQCHGYCSVCYGTGNDQCSVCKSGYYLWQGNTCLAACSPSLKQSAGDTTNIQVPVVSQTICTYPCTQGFYLDWYGDCQGSCDFPLQATTRRTDQDPIYVCNFPCTIGQYLYWDGMCENSCSTPVFSTPVYAGLYDGRYFCKFPCTTAANPIAYWDGSCSNKCDFPLVYVIEHNKKFCTNPCTTPGYYLYNNGSCLATCQTYFTTGIIAGQLLCNYPCASGEYLYTNGSCLATCNPLFYNLTMLADKYCYYPCLPTEWLYNNGSCLPTCDWRFNTRNLVGEKYCDFPCGTRVYLYLNGTCQNYCRTYFNPWFDKKTSDYYCDNPCNKSIMLNNGTCRSTCDSRYISYSGGSDKFCDYPCAPSHYLYTNGSCLTRCDPYYWQSNYLGDRFCDNPCLAGQYVSYNGSCQTTCNSPYVSQTFGTDSFCRSPCKTGDYLYSNNTCRSWCTPTFVVSTYGADKFCTYPCSSGQFLYQDGTCKSTCQTYFVQATYGTDKFCKFPCAVDKYLYQNGSCLSTCHSLFIETSFSGTDFKYCQRPCSLSTDFIYWDGTCGSGCPLPYTQRIEGSSNKFCVYPCDSSSSSNEYLYWNGSCLMNCEFPLRSRIESDLKKYCDYPCTSLEFLRWDGECIYSCSYPLRIKQQGSTEILCLPPCENSVEYFYQDTGICDTYCHPSLRVANSLYKTCSGTYEKSTGIINSLSTPPTDSRAVSFILPARMIQYIKYLDITLPPRLERLSQGKGNPPLCLTTAGLVIPEDAMPAPSQYVLPVVFWRQGLSQGFLANFWQPLMILALLLAIGTLFAVIEVFCYQAQWFDWKEIFERCRVIVMWNLIIMVIATNLDSIILYAALEIRAIDQGSQTTFANLFFCIISMIIAITVIVITCLIGPKIYFMTPAKEKGTSSMRYARFLTKWQSIQVVFRGFREDSLMNALFYGFYLVRVSLPSLIAAVMYTSPLAQSCLYVGISVSIIWYLLHSDPLKKKVNQVQLVLTELLVFAVNICVLILSVFENQKAEKEHTRVFLGDLIIICNFGINMIGVVFLGIKLLLGIRTVILLRKSRPQSAKIVLLQLLFLPFQQAAFGFEQVQVARFLQNYSQLTSYKPIQKQNNLRSQAVNSNYLIGDQGKTQNSLQVGHEMNISLNSEGPDLYSSFPINKISKRLDNSNAY